MEKLSNSVSAVIQMWKAINLRNSEDGDDTFSETSVQTSATRYKVPEWIFNHQHISWPYNCNAYLLLSYDSRELRGP
jgi:hypothetical protein